MEKYNNDSQFFKDWTTSKLKKEAKVFHQSIYVIESHGMKDIFTLSGILDELKTRGHTPNTTLTF